MAYYFYLIAYLFGLLCGFSFLVGCNALLGACNNDAAECEECESVGENHQVVECVGKLPYEVVGDQRAQEDEYKGDNGVDNGAVLGIFLAEEVLNVDLAEEVPAKNGGECEEEKADCNEDGAEVLAEDDAESGLGEVCLIDEAGDSAGVAACKRTIGGVKSADDNECVKGENNKGVDENAHHCNNALLVRSLDIGLCVCVGSRTHTGFIGEEAALGALRNGFLQRCADSAADDGLRHKCILEDHSDGCGEIRDTGEKNDDTADEEKTCHNGNDLFGDGCKALNAAQEDNSADNYENKTHNPGGDAESGLHSGTDGVGLNHAAEEAQGEDNGNCEETGEELAKTALECAGNVVNGAALDVAVCVGFAGFESEGSLSIDGGHTEEGDNPHPEDGAGTADEDSAGSTNDVAGTYLSCNSGCKSLEGAHAAFLLSAAKGEIAENAAHAFAEASYLNEASFNGVEKSDRYQQDNKNITGQIGVDVAYDGVKCGFDVCEKFQHSDFLSFLALDLGIKNEAAFF